MGALPLVQAAFHVRAAELVVHVCWTNYVKAPSLNAVVTKHDRTNHVFRLFVIKMFRFSSIGFNYYCY